MRLCRLKVIQCQHFSVQDSKSQLLNGGNQAMEAQEHKRKIEVSDGLIQMHMHLYV